MPIVPPADPSAAERGLARWRRLATTTAEPTLAAFVAASVDGHGPLLAAVFGASPFLEECLLAEPDLLRQMVESGPDAAWDGVMAQAARLDLSDRLRFMAGLRRSRRRVALLVALADLGGHWRLERVTGALTAFADLAVASAVDHLLLEAAKRGEVEPADRDRPSAGSGITVLSMGKHGAAELNYSSDIDLIVLFDEDGVRCRAGDGPMAVTVRLARSLSYVLETRTKDGYAFRTDLRLRPHLPGHPLAISTDAAELYYERHGQNWERASYIKARAVGGDLDVGELFLKRLQPFIWRKHLDYAAIRDIHSIKRQINAHRGFGRITVRGHDLKVGRGGIREIEFFTQTQQLILGGRVPALRSPRTTEALAALAAGRWVEPRAAEELTEAYDFLRTVEHRLQMVADKQTQLMPEREADFARVAAFSGFAEPATFEAEVRRQLEAVERHYAALFESEPDLGGGATLVFTGIDEDAGTLGTLRSMGFKDPAAVSQRIRGWHHGHIRATRSTRARELLTELTPSILGTLADQPDPDRAFRLFDEFVAGLPAGVQLFSLFRANPRLLSLLADLTGAAPRLAGFLAGNVDLFDAMLAPDFFERLPDRHALRRELAGKLPDARDLQDVLDISRRWAHGRQFQAGLQVLLGLATAEDEAAVLTTIAETVIRVLLPYTEAALAQQHGRVPQGRFAVLGLGKLGSRELTTGSDLDLVFVYDAPDNAVSDGERSLSAGSWYARLGQRIVSALSAQTAEGRLFEIDTRLRPSGNAGPVACSFENFVRYQTETAQTWEQQALTRARALAGDRELCHRLDVAITEAIRRPRDAAVLARDVRAMRERIFREHGSDDPWNLKHARGGLVEQEFCAQFVQLRDALAQPDLCRTSTLAVLLAAGETGSLSRGDSAALADALLLHHGLQAVLRLSLSDRFKPAEAPAGLREALVRAAAADRSLPASAADFPRLEQRLVDTQAAVRQIFDRLCPPGP
ncbi:MAG TPA: bifunctional [glutamine synthetase] adenylyltransferase/[glutamine synthetase]-adenylyl-L-tyrosine phosphorylase [Geminicoccaceae bacterium]|nr:bifunctional [glutamine synthetase] adenylyltransferase/[glutamine synthetase]-adenylyl-L-tyrosine phosphorylase [Geminicoccus sp.]HMU51348.1 bifunctional [glutamine synthetase] adenylyltransferase/[glutamine synthetase]-adenylyl-L-tyrosine phosphorylase [Geminicoccaceae bacterium]